MDWGSRECSRQRVRLTAAGLLLLALLIGARTARAEVVSVNGISIPTIVNAAKRQPVIVGYGANPDVPGPDVIVLRKLVRKLDPGRIWVVVTPPVSEHDIGEIANAVGAQLKRDGVVIGVAGYNFYASTTWGNRSGQILARAVGNDNEPLWQVLRNVIVAFAKADKQAHHPTPYADALAAAQKGVTVSQTSTTSNTAPTGTTPTAVPASATHHTSHGSSSGLIDGVITGGVVILLIAAFSVRAARRSARAAHVRRMENQEAHAKVQADFTRLGERISDLDIDQQMKGADPRGKAEYAQGLDCYQEAERRLKDEKDDYQFQKASEAVARDLLPAEMITRLTKLAALHKSGALTDAEFAAEKKKILS